MSQAAVTVERPRVPAIAAAFNLKDPKERRIFDIIQRFYAPNEADRLHDIKRGKAQGNRMVWTIGSFQPQRMGAKAEWTVTAWNVDEIEVRMQPCRSEREVRELFNAL